MDKDIDTSIENKYTGNNTYPLEVGYSLALAELSGKEISDSDLFTKTNGISGLPTAITDRIFSSNIASYTKVKNGVINEELLRNNENNIDRFREILKKTEGFQTFHFLSFFYNQIRQK